MEATATVTHDTGARVAAAEVELGCVPTYKRRSYRNNTHKIKENKNTANCQSQSVSSFYLITFNRPKDLG
jgi:hypothetical protein